MGDFLSISKNKRPIFTWRETTTQHFNTSDGYFYDTSNMLTSCAPLTKNATSQIRDDYRNRIFEEAIEKVKEETKENVKIPTMRIGHLFSEWNSHMAFVKAKNSFNIQTEFIYDCTHYCIMSGFMSFMREYLFNIVHTVVKETTHKRLNE